MPDTSQQRPAPSPAAAADHARVLIRAQEPSDLGELTRLMNDDSVVRGTMQVPHTSLAFRQARATWDDPHVRTLVAQCRDSGLVIGTISLHRNLGPRGLHVASLGMMVADAHQGRGVGTALMAAAVDIADNWWQIRRLQLEVYTDNEPAVALYRRFGFDIEGTLRDFAFRDGAFVDAFVMSRITRLAS